MYTSVVFTIYFLMIAMINVIFGSQITSRATGTRPNDNRLRAPQTFVYKIEQHRLTPNQEFLLRRSYTLASVLISDHRWAIVNGYTVESRTVDTEDLFSGELFTMGYLINNIGAFIEVSILKSKYTPDSEPIQNSRKISLHATHLIPLLDAIWDIYADTSVYLEKSFYGLTVKGNKDGGFDFCIYLDQTYTSSPTAFITILRRNGLNADLLKESAKLSVDVLFMDLDIGMDDESHEYPPSISKRHTKQVSFEDLSEATLSNDLNHLSKMTVKSQLSSKGSTKQSHHLTPPPLCEPEIFFKKVTKPIPAPIAPIASEKKVLPDIKVHNRGSSIVFPTGKDHFASSSLSSKSSSSYSSKSNGSRKSVESYLISSSDDSSTDSD